MRTADFLLVIYAAARTYCHSHRKAWLCGIWFLFDTGDNWTILLNADVATLVRQAQNSGFECAFYPSFEFQNARGIGIFCTCFIHMQSSFHTAHVARTLDVCMN